MNSSAPNARRPLANAPSRVPQPLRPVSDRNFERRLKVDFQMAEANEQIRIQEAYAKRDFPGRYTFFEKSYLEMREEIERTIFRHFSAANISDLGDLKILDIGCGSGGWLIDFIRWGAKPENLFGVDLLAERIALARHRLAGAHLTVGDARELPFSDAQFDIVLQSVVLSSVLSDENRAKIASGMIRVTRPKGLILSYDFSFDNPKNPDVRAVKKAELEKLFSSCAEVRSTKVTLAPPLARSLVKKSRFLFWLANQVGFLKTHLLISWRKQI
jgi:ubiquinone/menaquinone biosynthesis C-methylase UbiE